MVALDDVSFPLMRHGACADGRERRRQVDLDEDSGRHLQKGEVKFKGVDIQLKSPLGEAQRGDAHARRTHIGKHRHGYQTQSRSGVIIRCKCTNERLQ